MRIQRHVATVALVEPSTCASGVASTHVPAGFRDASCSGSWRNLPSLVGRLTKPLYPERYRSLQHGCRTAGRNESPGERSTNPRLSEGTPFVISTRRLHEHGSNEHRSMAADLCKSHGQKRRDVDMIGQIRVARVTAGLPFRCSPSDTGSTSCRLTEQTKTEGKTLAQVLTKGF